VDDGDTLIRFDRTELDTVRHHNFAVFGGRGVRF
jgi:hypothetical protein